MRLKTVLAAFLLSVPVTLAQAAEIGRFELPDGREVILDTDRTWKFADKAPASSECTVVQSAIVPVSVCLEENRWQRTRLGNDFEIGMVSTEGNELYLGVITERTVIPLDNLGNIVVQNLNEAANLAGARVALREFVTIDGWEWEHLRMAATVSGAPFEYEFFITAFPDIGTVQVLLFGAKDLFGTTEALRAKVRKSIDITADTLTPPDANAGTAVDL